MQPVITEFLGSFYNELPGDETDKGEYWRWHMGRLVEASNALAARNAEDRLWISYQFACAFYRRHLACSGVEMLSSILFGRASSVVWVMRLMRMLLIASPEYKKNGMGMLRLWQRNNSMLMMTDASNGGSKTTTYPFDFASLNNRLASSKAVMWGRICLDRNKN